VIYKTYGVAASLFIKGVESGDEIVEIIENDEMGLKNYALVTAITNVSFSCPNNTFCCGLFCCPQPIQSYLNSLTHIPQPYYIVNYIHSIDNMKIFATRYYNDGSDGTFREFIGFRPCRFEFEEGDYYHSERPKPGSAYYLCPNDTANADSECCDEKLCCKKAKEAQNPNEHVETKERINFNVNQIFRFAVIVILLIPVLCVFYHCFTWVSRKNTKNDYSKINHF
jgi:hypothetical protein